MSRNNIVLVRFMTKKAVENMVSMLAKAGYEIMMTGIDSYTVWNGEDLVFSASYQSPNRYFARASGQYLMPNEDIAAVV